MSLTTPGDGKRRLKGVPPTLGKCMCTSGPQRLMGRRGLLCLIPSSCFVRSIAENLRRHPPGGPLLTWSPPCGTRWRQPLSVAASAPDRSAPSFPNQTRGMPLPLANMGDGGSRPTFGRRIRAWGANAEALHSERLEQVLAETACHHCPPIWRRQGVRRSLAARSKPF